MIDLTTPWHDVAIVHYSTVAAISAFWGYMVKMLTDAAAKRYNACRVAKGADLEDLIEELIWRREYDINLELRHGLTHKPMAIDLKPLSVSVSALSQRINAPL